VLDFVAALRDCDFVHAGQILTASQSSMRDDFEITTEHIDFIADTAVKNGALGARMTGGGFGGCVIALARAATADRVQHSVRKAVHHAGYPTPTITHTHAGPGITRL
jgi:galactokinase